MRRAELIRHLARYGRSLLREGGRHSVFSNPATRKVSTIPRHREINDYLAKKICRDLEVPEPEPHEARERRVVPVDIHRLLRSWRSKSGRNHRLRTYYMKEGF